MLLGTVAFQISGVAKLARMALGVLGLAFGPKIVAHHGSDANSEQKTTIGE
jgi:hypothetical protein